MAILVQVTLFNEDTGEVEKQIIKTYDSSYIYELEDVFDKLRTQVIKELYPNYEY